MFEQSSVYRFEYNLTNLCLKDGGGTSMSLGFSQYERYRSLRKVPGNVYYYLSKNGRAQRLFFQLFIDRLSVRRLGGWGYRTPLDGERQELLSPAQAGGPRRAGGGWFLVPPRPSPSPGPRGRAPPRPRGPRLPRQQPAPPLRLGPHFRLVSGLSGLGFPAAAGFAAVDLRAHLREKKESKPGGPTRARSSSLCAAREGSWGQAAR